MMAAATAAKKSRRRRKRRDGTPRRPLLQTPSQPSPLVGDAGEPRRTLRPRRRRPLLLDDFADFDDYLHDDEDEEDDDEEQRRKHRKLKLVLKLHPAPVPAAKRREAVVVEDRRSRSASVNESRNRRALPASGTSSEETSSSSYVDEEEEAEDEQEEAVKTAPKRRFDGSEDDGGTSDGSIELEIGRKNVLQRRKHPVSGMSTNSVAGTPLPEKKLLEMILDKLQKKDKYRVFAEPVDPEELPDYFDVIEHPMDYGTVRKKLARNAYHSLEQFEDDVFLICSNAMQYNAPDTVYFRQARSMQEIGRKEFQRLRTEYKHDESDCKSEEKITVDPVEQKMVQKALPRVAQEPLGSDISSAATRASAGDACTVLSKQLTNGAEPPAIISGLADGSSSLGESKSDKVDELSVKDSPSKLGKKPFMVDEHRRDTYSTCDQQPVLESDLVFDILEDEPKELVAVELDAEYSYARSLARFAASLGPIGWKIASERIASALPAGVKFGPGWVGEYEPLPTPVLFLENDHQQQLNPNSGLQSKMSQAKHKKLEMVKTSRIGDFKEVTSTTQSQIDRRTSNVDSNFVKEENDQSRATELTRQLFSDTSETQPRFSAVMPQQKREKVSPNFTNAKSKASEQIGVPQSSAFNRTGINSVSQRSDFHPQVVNFRSSGIIPFHNTPLQPKSVEQVRPQAESSRQCVTNNAQDMHADEAVNRRFFGSSGSDSPSNIGFFPKNQPVILGNWHSPGSHEHEVNDHPQLMDSSKFIKQSNISNRSADFPQLVQSSVPPAGTDSPKSAAAAAARAWMSFGASSQSKQSASNLGLCSIQTESTSASFNTSWRTPNSSPRNIDGSKITPMSQGFRQPAQVIGFEPQIQNQGLVIFPQLVANDLARFRSPSPWQGLVPQSQKHNKVCPPDLNISFQQPGSPVLQSSGVLKDSQQPDLALQL